MSTLEDKILGEKTHYYCSSSEDEADDGGNNNTSAMPSSNLPEPRREGYSCNTGPKGVIRDWQRYKQLENEMREEKEEEKLCLIKKLSMNCQTSEEEERDRAKIESEKASEDEFENMIKGDDGYLEEYMKKRMEEMYRHSISRTSFGNLIRLRSGAEFLDAVDKERSTVTVICHVYSNAIEACQKMNRCLSALASRYTYVKFCCVEAASAGLSERFERTGVPALLVYKSANLVGNFVRLMTDLHEDFHARDVQNYLVERGFLPDPSLVPEIIKDSSFIRGRGGEESDDDELE